MIDFLRSLPRQITRFEPVTLIATFLAAGGFLLFGKLADEMVEGDLGDMDEYIFMLLREQNDPSNPIGGPQIEVAMRDLTALGGVTVLTIITVAVFSWLLMSRNRASAFLLLASVIGGQVLSTIFKMGFSRPRPDLVPHAVEVATASFPSGHSLMSSVTYLTLAVMLASVTQMRRLKVFYFVLASVLILLVGLSRLYLGVHWPSDILAGWTLGAAWAMCVWLASKYIRYRFNAR
ncbi:phosphatase PAP2 family protein [Marivivens aquimaris]|uniref:phosphatase PAP2 family protein n=1 Tax=Marivivens aquimaris TaxID=2774876 RepID=UPI00187FB5C4|nr:phosphatase PAP2 family protein [Marivivens aquimaris]